MKDITCSFLLEHEHGAGAGAQAPDERRHDSHRLRAPELQLPEEIHREEGDVVDAAEWEKHEEHHDGEEGPEVGSTEQPPEGLPDPPTLGGDVRLQLLELLLQLLAVLLGLKRELPVPVEAVPSRLK